MSKNPDYETMMEAIEQSPFFDSECRDDAKVAIHYFSLENYSGFDNLYKALCRVNFEAPFASDDEDKRFADFPMAEVFYDELNARFG
jgi:hypothetical protein